MAKSNRSIRNASIPKSIRDSVGIAHVHISQVFNGFREDDSTQPSFSNELLNVALDSAFTFMWEYDLSDGGNEFLEATFTPQQLFKAAAELGLLSTTMSRSKRLPRGLSSVQRLVAHA